MQYAINVSFLVLFSIQFIIKSLFHLCIFSIYLFLLPFTTLKRPSTIALHVVITWSDHLQFWCFSCQFSSWNPTSFCSNMGCSALVLLTDWPGNSLHWHSGTYSTLRLEIPFPRSSILLFLLMILVQGISTNSSMNQNILDQVHLKTDTSTSHLTDWWLYTEFQA